MVPETPFSPFHVSNEWIKRDYLRSDAVNADIYLVYFATIVLFGAFFDVYHRDEPVIVFLPLAVCVTKVNERINYLLYYSEEELAELEMEYANNWRAIVDVCDV